jgi:Tol biopolymer transport system component
MIDVKTGLPTRFTFDPANEFSVAWSADSRSVAFNSARQGTLDIYQKAADGAGAEQELLKGDQAEFPVDWSRDGRYLLYVQQTGFFGRRGGDATPNLVTVAGASAATQRLWILPMFGDRKPYALTAGGTGAEAPGGFSPDGRWVAYATNETGRNEVYVVPFPETSGGKWQISKAGGTLPRWSADGRELFYVSPDPQPTLTVARIETQGGALRVLDVRPLFPVSLVGARSPYGVSPDGQRFLINTPAIENIRGAPVPPTVIVDWTAAIRGPRADGGPR